MISNISRPDVVLIGVINHGISYPYSEPETEKNSWVDYISYEAGGRVSITATALSKMGVRPLVVGSIGDDDIGEIVKAQLRRNGVDFSFEVHKGVTTDAVLSEEFADGTKRHRSTGNSARLLTPGYLSEMEETIYNAKAVMFAGYERMELVRKHMADIFERSRKKGVVTLIDLIPSEAEEALFSQMRGQIFPNLDVLCLNSYQLTDIGRRDYHATKRTGDGATKEELLYYAARLLDEGIKMINLHWGKNGTIIARKGKNVHALPPKAKKIVLSNGTGDVQNAGVIKSILDGKDDLETARFANAVGALRVMGNKYPDLDEIEQLVKGTY